MGRSGKEAKEKDPFTTQALENGFIRQIDKAMARRGNAASSGKKRKNLIEHDHLIINGTFLPVQPRKKNAI